MLDDIILNVMQWDVLEAFDPHEEMFAKVNIRGTIAHEGVGENGIWVWVEDTLLRVAMNEKGVVFYGKQMITMKGTRGPPHCMAQVLLVQGGDCIIGALKLDSLRVHILGATLLI